MARPDRRVSPGAGRRAGAWLLVVVALAMAACSGDDSDGVGDGRSENEQETSAGQPVAGGTLRIGIERPASFDPAAANPASPSELLVADLLFDGLTEDRDGRVAAALAESWEPTPDLLTWRFTLRAGATFGNGRPVNAHDVKYTLERVAKLGSASLSGVRLEVITGYSDFAAGKTGDMSGIRPLDERTLEIGLNAPSAVIPELLASPSFGIVPAEAVEAVTPVFGEQPMGSGPFSFVGREGDVVRLVRTTGGSALLDGVEIHLHDDLAQAYAQFEEGELDWSLVPATRVDDAAERYGTDSFAPFHAELFYGFNLANPKFADVRFRQAIVKAIDREAIVDAVFLEVADPLAGVVPAGVRGHVDDPCGAPCAFDPEGARALVAQVFPGGGVPEVQIDYYAGVSEEAVAGIMENSLEQVGIPAARRSRPFEEYQSFAVSGQQELFRLGWIGVYSSPEAYLGPLFTAEGLDNATGFAEPNAQALLAAARQEPAEDARLARYAEVERVILEQAPIVPIAQFRTPAVKADRVQGLVLTEAGTFDGAGVWLAAS